MSRYTDELKVRLGLDDDMSGKLTGATNAIDSFKKAAIAAGAAFAAWRTIKNIIAPAIETAADFEANLVSLRAVSEKTGRDINAVFAAMETQIGGLASKATIASGFLKGMTTELDVDQINNMTTAIRNAAIAMGENFQTQFPLIIRAIKQLNPAILDNIGVTVRLDQVNKKIREGYYGLRTEINEATQQNAIYQEIMRQTAKYQGQEAEILKTTKGRYEAFSAAIEDLQVAFGQLITDSEALANSIHSVTNAVRDLTESIETFSGTESIWEKLALLLGGPDGVAAAATAAAIEVRELQRGAAEKFIAGMNEDLANTKNIIDDTIPSIKSLNVSISEMAEAYEETFEEENEFAEWLHWNNERRVKKELELHREAVAERKEQQRQLADAAREAAAEQQRQIEALLEQWALAGDAFVGIGNIMTDNLLLPSQDLTESFENLGNQLVRTYTGKALNALVRYVATQMVLEKANMAEVVSLKAEAVAMAGSTAVKSANSAATAGIVAATAAATATMAAELVGVKALTAAYISLAAAKAAATLGLSSGPSIAAATATKASLDAILLGFDDPLNDAKAYKSGWDYADNVMKGARERFASPGFGKEVVGAVSRGINFNRFQSGEYSHTSEIHIHFNGPITGTEFVHKELIPAIEAAINARRSQIKIRDYNLTGGPDRYASNS